MKLGEVLVGAVVAGVIGVAIMGATASGRASSASATENYRGVTCNYYATGQPGAGAWQGGITNGGTVTTGAISQLPSVFGPDLPTVKTSLHAAIDAAILAGTILPTS